MADVRCQDQCTEATETHLPVYLWQDAARRPKGIVLLLHGIGERAYSLNYLAQQLVSGGFVVYGLDERGHGWWHFHQKKGDPGYSCDFIRTVKDVDRLLSLLRKQHPSIPVFLVGESVGAAVAWRAAIDTPDAVDGIVLAGTGCRLKYANVSWIMSDILRNCWRWNHQINIVRYQRRYGSDDLPAFDEILKDREQRKTLTLNEVMGARRFLQKNCKFARQLEPHIPVLVIQGANDKILSAESAEKVFDATSASDKRYILVPECGHVLLGISRLKSIVNDSIITFLNEMTFRHAVATSEEMFDQHLVDQSYLVDEPNSDLHKAQFDRH
jgi:alpha-beta hydrolase superfamily lysophospholipase